MLRQGGGVANMGGRSEIGGGVHDFQGKMTNLHFPLIPLQLVPSQSVHISLSQPSTPVGLKYDDLLGTNSSYAAQSCV